jgi:hypothetical protein
MEQISSRPGKHFELNNNKNTSYEMSIDSFKILSGKNGYKWL